MKCVKDCNDKKCWNYEGCEWVVGRKDKEMAMWDKYRKDCLKVKHIPNPNE